MFQSAMLLGVGLMFLFIAPLVTSENGPKVARFVTYVFIALGVLCVKAA